MIDERRCAIHLRFPGYVIFDDGSVVSHLKAPRILSPIRVGKYVGLQLRNSDGVTQKIYLHRLVAETFHGAPPPGQEVRHLDGNKKRNSEDNLRWGTRAQNAADKVIHGTAPLGENHGGAKLTDQEVLLIRRLARAGIKGRRIAEYFDVGPMTVSRIINNQLWRHL